jgi:hypothetical protein
MPIPPFDGITNVLPPHLGGTGKPVDLSPYRCTMEEFVRRFAISDARKTIIAGLLAFRSELFRNKIEGFQWLAGSFVEDIETQERRDPGDVEVVTFVGRPDRDGLGELTRDEPSLWNRPAVKALYHVDHLWVSLGMNPNRLVEFTTHWYGLFTHRRDRVWKGIVEVSVFDPLEDAKAEEILRGGS